MAPETQKKRRDIPKSQNTHIDKKLMDFLVTPTVPPKQHDETELFLLSLAPQMRMGSGKKSQNRDATYPGCAESGTSWARCA